MPWRKWESRIERIADFKRIWINFDGNAPTGNVNGRLPSTTRTKRRRALEMRIPEADMTFPDALYRTETEGCAAAIQPSRSFICMGE